MRDLDEFEKEMAGYPDRSMEKMGRTIAAALLVAAVTIFGVIASCQ